MSGGSYDYVYISIDNIKINDAHLNPRRAAFQQLLKLVVDAMRDIEWVDSGDCGEGGENEAIDKIFNFITMDADKLVKSMFYDELVNNILKEYLK